MNRILWNKRGEEIDEIVIQDAQSVHIEQMGDHWWICIRTATGEWQGNFYILHARRMTFREQENAGITWDRDEVHT